ncbi:hypothetical protein Tco_1524507 [Tanacetum coccineum]
MRTRSSSNLVGESSPNLTTSNPRRRNRRRSKQPFSLEESPLDTMADQRTMAELLRAPTEGYAEAIVVPPILAENFELNYKDLLRACPHHGFTKLHQLDTLYNALNPADQDSLNSAAGGSLLERRTQDVLTIIENKSKVCNSRNKSIVSQVKSSDVNSSSSSEIAKFTHAVNQQTSAMTTAMTCLAADGNTFSEFQDNIQGYVSAAAVNYNQDTSYQALIQQNQVVPLSELEKIKKMNKVNIKAMQTQINNVKNELRNEMQTSIQASMSNQTNELKNMMASFFQMNTASSGSISLPGNTIANPKGELKAISTRSGLVLDGPSIPMPPPFINPEEDERAEETLTDLELTEYTIKVPPPLVQKTKPPSLRNYVMHQRYPRHPHIPYPSRMNQEKQQEKYEIQIHKFWQMFKQLHINITLADALILIPKYQKMLKSLISNKEKLLELANAPLNENCSAVILKKLPKKLGDPGKFLILSVFSELSASPSRSRLASLDATLVWKTCLIHDLVDTMPEDVHVEEHTHYYFISTIIYDDDDDLVEHKSEYQCFPSSRQCDSVLYEDFSEVDALPSTNNEDKVFNPGILIHKNLFEVTIRATPDKNVKKISISNASLILEDFNPPLYELSFHKEFNGPKLYSPFVHPKLGKMSTPGIHLHLKEDCLDFEASRAHGFVLRSLELQILSFIMGIKYPNLID